MFISKKKKTVTITVLTHYHNERKYEGQRNLISYRSVCCQVDDLIELSHPSTPVFNYYCNGIGHTSLPVMLVDMKCYI